MTLAVHLGLELERALRDLDSDELQRCRESLYAFVKRAWSIVEPRRYVDGWYIKAICDHLQACYEGRLLRRNLLINIAPRHAKSLICSVLFPAWIWANDPTYRMVYGSYSMALALDHSRLMRKLVASEWYQRSFVRGAWLIPEGDDRAGDYSTSLGGRRLCVAVDSTGTGFGGDLILIDDPHKAAEAYSEADREKAIRWYRDTLSSRQDDVQTGMFIVVGQRIHERDLTGWILTNEPDEFEWLCLPEEYDPARPCVTFGRPDNDNADPPEFWRDPRTQTGELLFAARFPETALAKLRRKLGAKYAAQYLQRPLDPSTALFKRHVWRWWRPRLTLAGGRTRPVGCDQEAAAVELPERCTFIISVDCTFKDLTSSDYVVMQVWAASGADRFLVDQVRGQWSFAETCRRLEALALKWPEARLKLVEDAANGPAVVSHLQRRVPGLVPRPAGKAGKLARAAACQPEVESGNVFLPEGAPWLEVFVAELEGFPRGATNDDQVDAMSQALNELAGRSLRRQRALTRGGRRR